MNLRLPRTARRAHRPRPRLRLQADESVPPGERRGAGTGGYLPRWKRASSSAPLPSSSSSPRALVSSTRKAPPTYSSPLPVITFARFQLTGNRRTRLRRQLRSAARIVVPSVAVIGFTFAVTDTYTLGQCLPAEPPAGPGRMDQLLPVLVHRNPGPHPAGPRRPSGNTGRLPRSAQMAVRVRPSPDSQRRTFGHSPTHR